MRSQPLLLERANRHPLCWRSLTLPGLSARGRQRERPSLSSTSLSHHGLHVYSGPSPLSDPSRILNDAYTMIGMLHNLKRECSSDVSRLKTVFERKLCALCSGAAGVAF
ncbi:hypothetical protein GJAV_G00152000 [Gymnothorax javanicus]|nr:hypothetical protein GJAV_G00152000 [Gymnothorax javanicus]